MREVKIGLIGGSGLGEALGAEDGERIEVETPFGEPSSEIVLTNWDGVDIAILQRHGKGHVHHPTQVPYRANIFALKMLGVTHVVASGATGSLREQIKPRDLVIADQVIDKTTQRASTFFDCAAVHVEFAEPFCPVMRKWLLEAGRQINEVTVHDGGTYVCMEGPAFSTKAESEMHRAWGGDLIGMTCMPEAKLAREAEMAYALVALPTDYDCWRPHDANVPKQKLLEEIIGHLNDATNRSVQLIKTALSDVSMLHNTPCAAHNALQLAIWSDKAEIPEHEIRRLEPIWGAYFN